ncbi:MAG TPA: carboxypeptidase-like regulatory domain-containing protein, partial [Bryobacteraceae bacterium]
MHSRFCRRGTAICLLIFSGLPAYAAQATGKGGTIQGTVSDPSGAVIADAVVSLTNGVTGYTQTSKSASDGTYRLNNIPPNQYILDISSAGFHKFQEGIAVRTPVPIVVNAKLALSGSTESITVEASPDTIENVPAAHVDVSQNLLA